MAKILTESFDSFGIPFTEMAKPSSKMKKQKFYHGTKTKASADKIWKEGILPDLSTTPVTNVSRPVAGRVYMAANVKESIPYMLGGAMAGSEVNPNWIKKDGQYGYLFVISGAGLTDVDPDEDQVGQAVHDHLDDPEELPWMDDYLDLLRDEPSTEKPIDDDGNEIPEDEYDGPQHWDLLSQVKSGEYEGWIKAGHVLLPHLTDKEKHDVIKKYGNVAHQGKVMPVEMWQFDKNKSEELKRDGSNFFQLAKKIGSRSSNQVESNRDQPGIFNSVKQVESTLDKDAYNLRPGPRFGKTRIYYDEFGQPGVTEAGSPGVDPRRASDARAQKKKQPVFKFGDPSFVNEWQVSYLPQDIDRSIGGDFKYRTGYAYWNLPARIKLYREYFGDPDIVHTVSGPRSAVHAVFFEKGKDMIHLWDRGNILSEFQWKNFEYQAQKAGYRIMRFSKGSLEPVQGYWLDHPITEGANGDWEKEGYKISHAENPPEGCEDCCIDTGDEDLRIGVTKDGQEVAHAHIANRRSSHGFYPRGISVDREHRRKGLATAMYQYAEKLKGRKLRRSDAQSDDAIALWNQPKGKRGFGEAGDDRWIPGGEQERIQERYATTVSARNGDAEVFVDPSAKEIREISQEYDSVRAFIDGKSLYVWNPAIALHQEVRASLKLTADALPLILYLYKGKVTDAQVTDNSKSTKWFHNPEVVDYIFNSPALVRIKDPAMTVSFFDEAIMGNWEELAPEDIG